MSDLNRKGPDVPIASYFKEFVRSGIPFLLKVALVVFAISTGNFIVIAICLGICAGTTTELWNDR